MTQCPAPGTSDPRWYQRLFEANPVPMWIYDLQTLAFLDVNEVACQKYGYSRDEFLSMTIRDIRPPEDVSAVEQSVLLTPPEVFNSGVWRHRLRDGRLIYVEITSHELTYNGRAARFVAPLDVTERVLAETALRQLNEELERRVAQRTEQLETSNRELVAATRAAERASQSKSEFLTRMSHELRTPLNAVIGFSRLLAEPGHGFPAERQAQFNGHILQAGEHLLTLISELMNLARIEAGKVELDLQPLALHAVLAECAAMIEPQAQARGLKTRFATPPEDLAVVADRTRLKQVLLNLLSNAVKYNRADGELTLAVRSADRQHLRVEVSDRGHGLAPEQVAHLFEPFNRLGRTQEGPGGVEGTGLGLVVTKHLVELMGGRIGVDSTPGQGSTFWIDLVVKEGGEAAAAADTPIAAPPQRAADTPGHHTVLLVEDDLPSQELVRAQLSPREDLRLITASNGREGVALAIAHRPAVILMDNCMPELTGHQAFELLAQDPRTAGIPVVAVSAGAETAAASDTAIPWFRRVAKPFGQGDLLRAIDAAIRREP
ncbi:ATP-binding protein [Roseateles sp.]|uniref:hybrid sensor histidine kinase/response regulator n=1 Tax=Roseateles sp. TaxID=1971397 RepID=UPI0031D39EE4